MTVYAGVYISLSLSIYIYIYIYIYEVTAPELEARHAELAALFQVRKGTDGVSANGVTADSLCFLTEDLFGYPRSPTFTFPKVLGRTFVPNPSKFVILQQPH